MWRPPVTAMQGSTHVAFGVATGLAVARWQGLPLPTAAAWGAMAGVAALAPDWIQLNVPGVSKTVKGLLGHRGFSHWLWAAGALYLAARAIYPALAVPLALGWLSHLALDTFNAPGVPLLWPLSRVQLASSKTGGLLDQALRWLSAAGILYGLVPYLVR